MEALGTRSWSTANEELSQGDIVYVSVAVFDEERKEEKYSDFFPKKSKTILQGEIISISKVTRKARVKFHIDGTISNIEWKWLIKHLSKEQEELLYTGG